jgi:bla regulator protein blaR1
MIPENWATPLTNHLWQSTVFAGAAALLALALRKNYARTRYRLWLIASLKFLIPFSLLVAIGSQIGWPINTPSGPPKFSAVVEQIGRPFVSVPIAVSTVPAAAPKESNMWPDVLFGLWACGFFVITLLWWRHWRSIRRALRAGTPFALEASVPVLTSPVLLEPGVFGIFRPVLVLPEGITGHLTSEQLQAVIAHEMCHIRGRDNLAAAIHMAVEAIFWFHPLVWWLGARLIEERERACDEEVLRLGSEPQVYAESILKTCQFYLESPLTCVSGITGADLKKRIVRIMTRGLERKLDLWRKLLLATAGAAAIGSPILIGILHAHATQAQSSESAPEKPSEFEVASIKPADPASRNMRIGTGPGGRFTAEGIPLKLLIEYAYKIHDFQISGPPDWVNSARYNIEAKAESSPEDPRKLSREERDAFEERQRQMIQSLLADRFQLKLHRATKEAPVYALVVGRGGPKLKQAATPEGGNKGSIGNKALMMMRPGQLTANGVPMSQFADNLSNLVSRVVIDRTELSGTYDLTLTFTPERNGPNPLTGGPGPGPGPEERELLPPPDPNAPDIFTALQEQLGLKLEPQKGPVETLVIDHIERPSAN